MLNRVNDIIRALPSAPHPCLPVGARLSNFVETWSSITQDSWALSILRKGHWIPFVKEPPLSSSPILFPVAQQHLSHLREEVQIFLEKKVVEILPLPVLQPDFPSQENWLFSSNYRSILTEQNDEDRALSNGNNGLDSEIHSSRDLGSFHRSYGCIPPYSHPSIQLLTST